MKNSKINKNRPEISSNDINKTKDFDFIIKHSKKTFPYRKSLIIGGILSSFILIGIALLKNQKEIQNPIKNNKVYSQINFNNNHEIFTIATDTSYKITTKDKSIIEIPLNAFMLNGLTVTDTVQLKFEQYTTIPEIFISQIPMTYDSANNQYHFESAGMFNISAYDFKGNKLSTNPNALITVKMSSSTSSQNFNQYYLNEEFPEGKKWEYIRNLKPLNGISGIALPSTGIISSSSNINSIKENRRKIKLIKQKMDSIAKANIPRIPKTANKDRYALNIAIDSSKFPELVPFNSVLFEINPYNPEFNLEEIKSNWNDIELSKENGKYALTLFKNGKKRTIIVTPVISSSNKQSAQNTYDQMLADYQNRQSQIFEKEQAIMDSLSAVNNAIEDSIILENNRVLKNSYYLSEEEKNKEKVYRLFVINNFGTYNSDCPRNLPRGYDIESPVFVNKKQIKDTLHFHKIYLAEYGNNTLYTLYKDAYDEKISFNPNNKTVLWGITRKNKLAVIELSKEKKESKLVMELHEINNETNKEYIRKQLKWQ